MWVVISVLKTLGFISSVCFASLTLQHRYRHLYLSKNDIVLCKIVVWHLESVGNRVTLLKRLQWKQMNRNWTKTNSKSHWRPYKSISIQDRPSSWKELICAQGLDYLCRYERQLIRTSTGWKKSLKQSMEIRKATVYDLDFLSEWTHCKP